MIPLLHVECDFEEQSLFHFRRMLPRLTCSALIFDGLGLEFWTRIFGAVIQVPPHNAADIVHVPAQSTFSSPPRCRRMLNNRVQEQYIEIVANDIPNAALIGSPGSMYATSVGYAACSTGLCTANIRALGTIGVWRNDRGIPNYPTTTVKCSSWSGLRFP